VVLCTSGACGVRSISFLWEVYSVSSHVSWVRVSTPPAERLGELLTCADIHLLPQRADAADLVMPSKLTGMLASGRPVVATAHAGVLDRLRC